MSNYTQTTNFGAKDSLATGNPNKVIYGADVDTEFGGIQTAVNSKADIISLVTTYNVTQTLGDNSTKTATTAYVDQTAFSTVLPAQSGNSGKYLSTNGTAASWVNSPVILPRSARTSNTILAAADVSNLIDITSGTFTQTFTAAATLGSGWFCYIKNSGTGDITLDPNSTETIDGLTSYIMYPGEARLIQCDGSNFFTVLLEGGSRTFTASGSFTWPPGITKCAIDAFGAGGGGGGGGALGGSGGGGGGARVYKSIPIQAAGTVTTVTIGAGGTAGTANEGSGGAGGNSTFGSLVTAYAGSGGIYNGGGSTAGGGGGAGGAGTTNGNGGLPSQNSAFGSSAAGFTDNVGGGGGSGAVTGTRVAGRGEWGGGGGGSSATGSTGNAGGGSLYSGGGGGGGSNVGAGGAGGAGGAYTLGGGGAGGSAAIGADGAGGTNGNGGSGGGGGGVSLGGGAGGAPAGAGGGGGVGTSGNPGGVGARGEIRIYWQ